MFSNGFVVCVKQGSNLVSESERGVCQIEFGSEYAIRLRNKNSRDAVAQIFIDGENVSGGGYVVRANSFEDVERHFDAPTKFKFMSVGSEAAIDDGKNNRSEKMGLIQVSWRLAVEPMPAPIPAIYHHGRGDRDRDRYRRWISKGTRDVHSSFSDTVTRGMGAGTLSSMSLNNLNDSGRKAVFGMVPDAETLEGCTVPGDHSTQKFGPAVSMQLEGVSVTVTVQLVGKVQAGSVNFCSDCGNQITPKAKFCSSCGKRV